MDNLRANMQVVLAGTRFPENIGMVARACANMGVSKLAVAGPELWPGVYPCPESDPGYRYVEKALAVATSAGREVLSGLRVFENLGSAIACSSLVFGTTARTGGWRQDVIAPQRAAELAFGHLEKGGLVSLVFGPEDQGLSNEDIEKCSRLVYIPTASEPSLNLAQAVLILLYDFSRACPFSAEEKTARAGAAENVSIYSA